jgi:phosphatidylinositol-bisphosphatase
MNEAQWQLHITPTHFIVTPTQLQAGHTGQTTQLVIDRVSGVCRSTDHFNPLIMGATRDQLYFMEVYAFLGIVTLSSINFIVVVTEAATVASLQGSPLLTVRNVEFIPFEPQMSGSSDVLTRQIQGLTRLLTIGFYFSCVYDLTNSLQRQGGAGTLHDRADPRFYWNSEMYRDFSLQGVDSKWFVPLVQGYIGTDTNFIGATELNMVLISRRSCFRAGTRYNARGIDDEGNVANFVETEQVIIVRDNLFSTVQVRGSVPVFWQQTGITTSLALTRSRELTTAAFLKHLESVVGIYKHILFVNLLSSTKTHEQTLTDALQTQLRTHQTHLSQVCAYVFFDFHGMCSGSKYENLKVLLDEMEEMMNYYLFFYTRQGETVCAQKGVIRINCLDCLDRTNVVMTRVAWHSLATQLQMIGLPLAFDFDDANLAHPLLKSFKNIWADNGDMLSYEYTGTGSTISSVTRNGRQSIRGLLEHGMKSVSRFYHANVEDNSRQEFIELLLKRRADGTTSHLVSKVSTEITAREHEYSDFSNLVLQVCTWNMGGRTPPPSEDLRAWLMSDSRPDIVVVALQEIVPLSAMNILPGANASTVLLWSQALSGALQMSRDKYLHVKDEDMFGCFISVYAKQSIATHITRIASDKVKTGFKGKLGNKGSVLIRFNIFDTSICIWNCHLASGNGQVSSRCSQLEDIEQRGFQNEAVGRTKSFTVDDHNVKILVGDLNFRLDVSNFDARRLVAEQNLKALLENDQLLKVKKSRHHLLSRYIEPEITFMPTYKYDFSTHNYDSSRKQRTPSWCDRILYSGTDITSRAYDRVELLHSDHRPVYAIFDIRVRAVDTGRRSLVEMDVYSRLQASAFT